MFPNNYKKLIQNLFTEILGYILVKGSINSYCINSYQHIIMYWGTDANLKDFIKG